MVDIVGNTLSSNEHNTLLHYYQSITRGEDYKYDTHEEMIKLTAWALSNAKPGDNFIKIDAYFLEEPEEVFEKVLDDMLPPGPPFLIKRYVIPSRRLKSEAVEKRILFDFNLLELPIDPEWWTHKRIYKAILAVGRGCVYNEVMADGLYDLARFLSSIDNRGGKLAGLYGLLNIYLSTIGDDPCRILMDITHSVWAIRQKYNGRHGYKQIAKETPNKLIGFEPEAHSVIEEMIKMNDDWKLDREQNASMQAEIEKRHVYLIRAEKLAAMMKECIKEVERWPFPSTIHKFLKQILFGDHIKW